MTHNLEKAITKATFENNRILMSSRIILTLIYLRVKISLLVNNFAEKQFHHL